MATEVQRREPTSASSRWGLMLRYFGIPMNLVIKIGRPVLVSADGGRARHGGGVDTSAQAKP